MTKFDEIYRIFPSYTAPPAPTFQEFVDELLEAACWDTLNRMIGCGPGPKIEVAEPVRRALIDVVTRRG